MDDRLHEMVEDDFCDRHAFEERMEMPIEAEASACRDRKVAKFMCDARFKLPSTCVEDVACLRKRKLGRDRVARLSARERVETCKVVAMVSKMGCGKSSLGRTLGDAACRGLFTACYARLADMMGDLNSPHRPRRAEYARVLREAEEAASVPFELIGVTRLGYYSISVASSI